MEVGRLARLKRSVRHLSPRHAVKSLLARRVVQKVAAKYGLVYFGFVDQHTDEHALVRGHTVSRSSLDSHYCAGTIQEYDVTFVQRNDLARMLNGTEQRCHWLIVSIRLKSAASLPHFYVGPKGDNELFRASYTMLHHVALGHTTTYSGKFLSNFSVFARPSDAIDLERVLSPSVAEVLVSHFAAMPFEVEDGVLHVYNENRYPTAAAIDSMLENGVWLAKNLDAITSARGVLDE